MVIRLDASDCETAGRSEIILSELDLDNSSERTHATSLLPLSLSSHVYPLCTRVLCDADNDQSDRP